MSNPTDQFEQARALIPKLDAFVGRFIDRMDANPELATRLFDAAYSVPTAQAGETGMITAKSTVRSAHIVMRLVLAEAINEFKVEAGLPVQDLDRERMLLDAAKGTMATEESDAYHQKHLELSMQACRTFQTLLRENVRIFELEGNSVDSGDLTCAPEGSGAEAMLLQDPSDVSAGSRMAEVNVWQELADKK